MTWLSEIKRICRECRDYVIEEPHKCREAPKVRDWETEADLIQWVRETDG